jgi:hypothetical protein
MQLTIDKDVWAGLFFMGLAALGLWIGTDYAFGTAARMGAGFLPKLLCWLLLGLGGLITLIGIVRRGEPMEAWAWGQTLAILSAVLVFGAALEGFGLEVAILGSVLVGGVAEPEPSRFERALLAVLATLLAIFLWPGTAGKLAQIAGTRLAANWLLAAAAVVMALAIASHARSVPLLTMLERVALALGLGAACIIVFVDGLGLNLKSTYVMDGWQFLKATVIKPLLTIVR